MKLLDLFCGAGGAARGYQLAGFHVTGVDIVNQPRYGGDEFVQCDALDFVTWRGRGFDVIHASPPCQRYSLAQRIQDREHPDLVGPTRQILLDLGLPYVIENVEGFTADRSSDVVRRHVRHAHLPAQVVRNLVPSRGA